MDASPYRRVVLTIEFVIFPMRLTLHWVSYDISWVSPMRSLIELTSLWWNNHQVRHRHLSGQIRKNEKRAALPSWDSISLGGLCGEMVGIVWQWTHSVTFSEIAESFSAVWKTILSKNKTRLALTGAAQLGWASSEKPKVWGSGHRPGLQVRSPVSVHAGGNQSMFLSLCFTLPLESIKKKF